MKGYETKGIEQATYGLADEDRGLSAEEVAARQTQHLDDADVIAGPAG